MMDADASLRAFERACVERVIEHTRGRGRRSREDDDDSKDDADFASTCREIVRREAKRRRREETNGEEDAEDDGFGSMTEAEIERVLTAMAEARDAELEREEREVALRRERALSGETSEEAEETERLARAIEAFERWKFPVEDGVKRDAEDDEDVLCPVCGSQRVLQNRHVLFCTCGKFRLARLDEKVGLRYLKSRLARTFESHAERGCGRAGELRFDVRDEYGLDACVARCEKCTFLEIVM